MTIITVSPDGAVSTAILLPAGEHGVVITTATPKPHLTVRPRQRWAGWSRKVLNSGSVGKRCAREPASII